MELCPLETMAKRGGMAVVVVLFVVAGLPLKTDGLQVLKPPTESWFHGYIYGALGAGCRLWKLPPSWFWNV